MLYVRNIRLPLTAPVAQAQARALRTLGISASQAARCEVARLSVDARRGHPVLVYTIAVTLKDEGAEPALAGSAPCVAIAPRQPLVLGRGTKTLPHRPVVCGLGPAGLFCALVLARQGYQPLVLERGPALDDRVRAVEQFSATGVLNPNANIQFGEGGGGHLLGRQADHPHRGRALRLCHRNPAGTRRPRRCGLAAETPCGHRSAARGNPLHPGRDRGPGRPGAVQHPAHRL